MGKQNRGHLIIVSGPSGVGKGSICDKLIEDRVDIKISVSVTTREPRPGEIDGIDYYYVSEDEFKKMIEDGQLIEYSYHFGNYYGTPKDKVDLMLERGENVILEIDVNGGAQVGQKYPNTVCVFILPPNLDELKKRIKGRGTEDEDHINMRLRRLVKELEYMQKYHYAIVNGSLDQAVKDLELIIDSLKLKVSENLDAIELMKSEFEAMMQKS